MYNYMYEEGKITYACESAVTIDNYDFVTSKTPIWISRYFYDKEDTLTKKRVLFADGNEQVISYTTAENESQLVKTQIGENSFVSTSKTDSFGRKEFDELQLGSGFVSRQFDYVNGEATDEHKSENMLKSTPTTQLVSEITFQDGRTIDYEYDAEERITKVIDSVEGVTEYTYDSLGQLLTETKNGEVINQMTYDNYGNIKSKNGINYAYNGVWKDRLSHVGGKEISYDVQGNPTEYLGHFLHWEKGRQLKSFDNTTYTYNANGIRTSKTVDKVRHDFYLDGGKILRETWLDNILETVFDNEENVCGIVYNGKPYYFMKNLQGDVIAITNKDGEIVARYSYDAWGKCEVDSSSKNAEIAHINPFRYRSYYYDRETNLYYLQSRYYDAEVGRFLNGDMAEIAVMQQGAVEHNLFGYCHNNVVNSFDSTGYISLQLGAFLKILLYLVKIAIFALIVYMLISFIVSPEFQRIWNSFCIVVGNSFSNTWNTIAKTYTKARTWTGKQIDNYLKNFSKLIDIAKATAKIITAVKTIRNAYIGFYELYFYGDLPIIGKKINKNQAVTRAKKGGNSITYFRYNALWVANTAGKAKAMHHQPHGGTGYFSHYHINKHKNSAHISYITI